MTATIVRATTDAQLRARVLSALTGESQNVSGWWKRYKARPDALAVVELREMLRQSETMAFALIQIHGPFGAELQRVRATLRDAMPLHTGGGWPEGGPTDGEDTLDTERAPEPTLDQWRAIHTAADRYVRTLDRIGETLPVAEEHAEPVGGQDDSGGVSKSSVPKPTPRERKMRWLAEAMLIVTDNPGRSDSAIATLVGVNPGQLSRSEEYQMAATLARSRATAGQQGEDVSLNLNRPASRQTQDEEDTDSRIDRATHLRNPKRNAKR